MSAVKFDRQRSRVGQFFSRLFHHRPRPIPAETVYDRQALRFRRWPGDQRGTQTTLN